MSDIHIKNLRVPILSPMFREECISPCVGIIIITVRLNILNELASVWASGGASGSLTCKLSTILRECPPVP